MLPIRREEGFHRGSLLLVASRVVRGVLGTGLAKQFRRDCLIRSQGLWRHSGRATDRFQDMPCDGEIRAGGRS